MSLEGLSNDQIKQLASGMQTLLTSNDADTRRGAQRLLKKVDPKLTFPELEQEDALAAAIKPIQEDNQKLRDEIKERDFRAQVEKDHARVTGRGYKVEDVQKFMQDRGIVNFDTAMEVLDMQNRLASPTPESLATGQPYNMPEEQKDIFANPSKWAREMAHKIIGQNLARKSA